MAPFATRGLGFWPFATRNSQRIQMDEGGAWKNGRMRRGRNFVRSEDLEYYFEALVRTQGFFSVVMALREELTIAWRVITGFLGNRSPRGRSGA